MPKWSNGHDPVLSRRGSGFDSPFGRHAVMVKLSITSAFQAEVLGAKPSDRTIPDGSLAERQCLCLQSRCTPVRLRGGPPHAPII